MLAEITLKSIEDFEINDRGVLPLLANFSFDQFIPENFDHGVVAAGHSTREVIMRCIQSVERKGFDSTILLDELVAIRERKLNGFHTELHYIVIRWR